MANQPIEVTSVASGFNYSVFIGTETDNKGRLNTASANRIVGGWAATKAKAQAKATEVLSDE